MRQSSILSLSSLHDSRKRSNKKLAQERVGVENVVVYLKKFMILQGRYRNRRKRFWLRFNLIAAIYNARTLSLFKLIFKLTFARGLLSTGKMKPYSIDFREFFKKTLLGNPFFCLSRCWISLITYSYLRKLYFFVKIDSRFSNFTVRNIAELELS